DKSAHQNHAILHGGAHTAPSDAPVGFIPPSTPVGFRAIGLDNQVLLKWQFNPEADIDHYNIYAAGSPLTIPIDGDPLITVPKTINFYSDATVVNGDKRYYRLIAVNDKGQMSQSSPEVVGKAAPVYDDYLTGVYYYPWYSNTWGHNWPGQYLRDYLQPRQSPVLGHYDCRDQAVIQQHLDWCKEYGIDLWVCSWWGKNSNENVTIRDYIKSDLGEDDVKFAIFYESFILGNAPWVIDATKEAKLLADYQYLAQTYFSHPNYFKINGAPVVYIYVSGQYQGNYINAFAGIRQSLKNMGYDLYLVGDEMNAGAPSDHMNFLDAVTAYNMLPNNLSYAVDSDFFASLSAIYDTWETAAHARGKKFVPLSVPGFNNRKSGQTSPNNSLLVPRRATPGASQTSMFEEYIGCSRPFVEPDLKWIMITSWNEWHEDTQIEPLNPAAATNTDISPGGNLYTNGTYYEGYGTKCLEVVKKTLARGVSAVAVIDEKPMQFELLQNYPNPFNATTHIAFHLSEKSRIAVEIYDLAGRKIVTVASGYYSAGTHTVTWRATSSASGVYVCRLSSEEGHSVSKKVVLIK
ncbi:T9SS type A sorting domain-containing protein, partial [candidate division KSB1 bacterium]|nr:T9SS type A sorting domain-containing protein [candidate division KSB1 bacterium]